MDGLVLDDAAKKKVCPVLRAADFSSAKKSPMSMLKMMFRI